MVESPATAKDHRGGRAFHVSMQGTKFCPRCGRAMSHDSIVCAYCGTRLPGSVDPTSAERRALVCSRCGRFLPLRRVIDKKAMCEDCESRFHNEVTTAHYKESYRRQNHVREIVATHPQLTDKVAKRLGVAKFDNPFSVDDRAYYEICEWNAKVAHAKNLEMARRYEDAAVCYEQLGLWKEAGLVRDKKSSTTVKHVTININDLIDKLRAGGLSIPYKCSGCGATITVGKDTNPDSLKFCSYCGAAMNVEMLADLLRDALK